MKKMQNTISIPQNVRIKVKESIPVELQQKFTVQKCMKQNAMKALYPKKKFICINKDILKEAKIISNVKMLNEVNVKDLISDSSNFQTDLNKIENIGLSKQPGVNKHVSEVIFTNNREVIAVNECKFSDETIPCIEVTPLENLNIMNQSCSDEIKLCVSKNLSHFSNSNKSKTVQVMRPYQESEIVLTPISNSTGFSVVNQQNILENINEICYPIETENLPTLCDKKISTSMIETIIEKTPTSIDINTATQKEQLQLNDTKYKNTKRTKMKNLLNPLNDICEDFNRNLKKFLIPKIGHAATVSILLRFNQVRNLQTKKNLLEELFEYLTNFEILQNKKNITNKSNCLSSYKNVKSISTQTDEESISTSLKTVCTNTRETQTSTNENQNNCIWKLGHYNQGSQEISNELATSETSNDFLDKFVKYFSDSQNVMFESENENILNECIIEDEFYKNSNLSNIQKTNKFQKKIIHTDKKMNSSSEMTESLPNVIFKLHIHKEWTNCNLPDPDGYLPIHKMVLKNNELLVKRQCLLLKSKNLDVNIKTSQHEMLTPLHIAIENRCKLTIISTLLENKADPQSQDFKGNTCLHYAVQVNYVEALKKMLETNIEMDLNIYNYDGFTPLLYSVILNRIEIIDILIKHGANINAQDRKSGRTAIFHAIENNFDQTFKLLLDNGANMKIKMMSGLTAWDAIHELSNVNIKIIDKLEECESYPSYLKYSSEIKKRKSQNTDLAPVKKRKYVRRNVK